MQGTSMISLPAVPEQSDITRLAICQQGWRLFLPNTAQDWAHEYRNQAQLVITPNAQAFTHAGRLSKDLMPQLGAVCTFWQGIFGRVIVYGAYNRIDSGHATHVGRTSAYGATLHVLSTDYTDDVLHSRDFAHRFKDLDWNELSWLVAWGALIQRNTGLHLPDFRNLQPEYTLSDGRRIEAFNFDPEVDKILAMRY